MSGESTFEHRVIGVHSVGELVSAARAEGLHVTTEQSDFDQSGLDFRVVHGVDADGVRWIVRTPRRPDVIEAARVEARALRLVAPRLPIEVPSWRVHTDLVIAYPRLDGQPAITLADGGPTWNVIDPAALPATFLDSFAATLAALQRIDVADATAAGLPVRPVSHARAAIASAIEATRTTLAPSEAVLRRWQRWLADDALWPSHVALVHGDLHPGHMLLGPDGALVGVLDWTEAQVTDPSVDLAMFYGCFGAGALGALLERLERAGATTWSGLSAHAIERWAAFPATVAEWALRTENAGALEHARAQLASVTASAAG